MSEMKYQKEFEEFVRNNPEFLGGNTLTVQRENYGVSLYTPEYAASYVRFSYEMFCKIKEKLEQELRKTREQLSESNELLIDVRDIFQDKIFLLNINDSCFSRLRRWNNDSQKYIDKYFKDKDKQGE